MYADVPRFLQEKTAAGSLPIHACSLTELSFLSLTRSLENALVDEVGLGAFDLRKDVVHFLSSPKSVVVHPLALAACAFPGPTAARLFLGHFDFCMKFHKQNVLRLKNNLYLCSTKPEAGRVSPPFGRQIQIFNLILIFQILMKIEVSIGLRVFCFLLFLRFSEFSSCHLLTLQRYEKYLNYANKIKNIFH